MMFLEWWSKLSATAKTAGSVAAISAAVVSTGSAWTFLDLPVIATRTYVLAQIGDIKNEQKAHSYILFDIRRSQLDREIVDLQRRANRTPDDDYRLRMIQENLRQLDGQVDALGRR